MKTVLRYFLINLTALFLTTQFLPGLTYTGGLRSLIIGAFVFMLINFVLVPLLKILFLPLNLLTLGLFSWVINVLALFALTTAVSEFMLKPYSFPGINIAGIGFPALDLSVFWVAVVASFMIGVITNFLQWVTH